MNIVLGASGLVGGYIYKELQELGEPVIGTCFSSTNPEFISLDIAWKAKVHGFLSRNQPNRIFICASSNNVDYCQNHPEETYRVNVKGVDNVVEWAKDKDCQVIFVSTGYVFGGSRNEYRYPDSTPNPINEYGKQKLIAEYLLLAKAKRPTIIRTMWVYGIEEKKKNFVYFVLRNLSNGTSIEVSRTHYGTPTYAKRLAKYAIAKTDPGIFHFTDGVFLSRIQWAYKIADTWDLPLELIIPTDGTEYNQRAPRPYNASVDMPNDPYLCRTYLDEMTKEIENGN